MKKRMMSLLLALFLVLSALPGLSPMVEAKTFFGKFGAEGDNLSWSLDTETGKLSITGKGSCGDMLYKVPWAENVGLIKSVSLPKGLTDLGDQFFQNCRDLKAVTIPETVTMIGEAAFQNCASIEKIVVPKSVKEIRTGAFCDCTSLKEIQISDYTITKISYAMLKNCPNLTSFRIPKGVTEVEWEAFMYDKGLKELYVPASVKQFTTPYFSWCSLEKLYIEDYVKWNEIVMVEVLGDVAASSPLLNAGHLYLNGKLLKKMTFPEGVQTINPHAFEGAVDIEEVTLPSTLNAVERFAFSGCTKLKKITFLNPKTEIRGKDYQSVIGNPELTTIVGYDNSTAYEYAGKNGYKFISLGKAMTFEDVPADAYYAAAVRWAVNKNITKGTDSTHFSPEATCTRGHVVTFLWRAMGKPKAKSSKNPFTDVNKSDYYYDAVLWAVENKITTGTGNGKFSPEAPCTRGEVATFLWRAAGKPKPKTAKNPFSDVTSTDFYYRAVLWAVENKITTGVGGGKFAPNDICTRGQVVTFLYRALN